MRDTFNNFSLITEANIRRVLQENKYYGKDKAVKIVLEAKAIVEEQSFNREEYFLVQWIGMSLDF